MQILKTQYHASCIEYGPWLLEYISMNVHHQVSTSCIFHDEAYVLLQYQTKPIRFIVNKTEKEMNRKWMNLDGIYLGLEACKQID